LYPRSYIGRIADEYANNNFLAGFVQKHVSLRIGVLTWNGAKWTKNSPEVGSILGQPVSYLQSYIGRIADEYANNNSLAQFVQKHVSLGIGLLTWNGVK
jgi:hypothetical protein